MNRIEQVAWTHGVCACRRNSQVSQAIPWSRATKLSLKTRTQRLLMAIKNVVHPLNWMACNSSFWVQINCTVQCRVPSPDFDWFLQIGSGPILPSNPGSQTQINISYPYISKFHLNSKYSQCGQGLDPHT